MKVATAVMVCLGLLLVALSPWILDNIRYQDFTIAGTVVDEQGEPLQDVAVWITTGRSIKMGFESESASRSERIDGSFEYKFKNRSIVSLLFMKDGFERPQELHWRDGGIYRGVRVVMKRRPATIQENPMTPHGEPALSGPTAIPMGRE